MPALRLTPQPKSVVPAPGHTRPGHAAGVFLDPRAGDALHEAASAFAEVLGAQYGVKLRGAETAHGAWLKILPREAGFAPEAHELHITPEGVTVRAGDDTGAYYALGTLLQLTHPEGLACGVIEDAPALAERGFMLDVSRTKVPALETILRLVNALSSLRYNRLQLYVEHTFAFPGHELVWGDSGALTPEDIRTIDAHCKSRFITLVPNLNGFGHLERWLKYPEYQHLAECPEGFWHDLAHSHRDPGTLKPNAESLAFMASLYDAYLPHFGAAEFNVGGDEPWELGQGWSKPLCEAKGKQTVYLEHMRGLHSLCKARGKRMQFWADILLEHPERAGEAPEDAVPVIWGYDAGHPFPAQCATLKDLGRTFLVAPGASTWNSFSSRWENARVNIREAVDNAVAVGAAGFLMTAWGDNGNHWAWPVMYPSLVYAACLAWNPAAEPDLAAALDATFFGDDGASARALLAYLASDAVTPKTVRNKSVLWEILFNPPARRAAALEGVSENHLRDTLAHLECVEAAVFALSPEGPDPFLRDELLNGVAISRLACRRGLAEITGVPDTRLRHDLQKAIGDYERVWLLRARVGGLAESAGHLRRVLGEL